MSAILISAMVGSTVAWSVYNGAAVARAFRLPLYSRRLPRWWVCISLIKRYRGRSSLVFFARWMLRPPRRSVTRHVHRVLPALKPEELPRLEKLYGMLEPEIGHFHALTAMVELARNL